MNNFVQTMKPRIRSARESMYLLARNKLSLAALILLLLLCCAPWVTIPALVLGLFLGLRYRFSGPDLERESLNNMMGSVADTAADLGHKVMDELKHDWHSDEKDQK